MKGSRSVWMSKNTIMAKVEKFPFNSAKFSKKSDFISLPNKIRHATLSAA